ncbi:lysine 2,3-aminomutase, partial [Bacillus spizizenii]|nr:lysine 2,3-aminomutase [Bacillus spizizenii]
MTEESVEACEKLVNAGVQVGNQAVVLAGINDSVPIMKKLMHDLVKIRVRPCYMYPCALSEGVGTFRAAGSNGLASMVGL